MVRLACSRRILLNGDKDYPIDFDAKTNGWRPLRRADNRALCGHNGPDFLEEHHAQADQL
jgi:hypothetical protein